MKSLIKISFAITIIFCCKTAFSQQTLSTPKFRQDFLSYINRVRKKGCNCGINYMPPAPPLTWNYQLESAAIGHAVDMANQHYFDHTSLDGRTMQDRIYATGYTLNGFRSIKIGENIASGQQSVAEVMQAWLNSEGHCHNLMAQGFREIGIARANDYWVQDFGGRGPFTPEEQRLIKSGKYRIVHSN